jgi:hypothetical protein
VLQLDLRRGDDALATLIRADGEIPGGATPMLNLCMVEAYVATGDVGQAELRAVAAVNEDSEDLAMRSSVARALVNAMRTHLLPIMDEVQLQRFKHTVAVAAWCAQGAPEAEDLVRPFRMWGVVADNRMYSGDIKKRAFFAVATGYMILPVLNRAKSKPQWQIVRDGPTSVGEDVFAEVMLGAVCRATHASATQRLEWWAEFIAAHPELKSMFGAGVES